MKRKILIVEDEFVEANNLRLILERAGYEVTGTALSFTGAIKEMERTVPDLVMLDIFLKGKQTGIDLANVLKDRHIAFVYLSANSNKTILDAAKRTEPYGFLVKPFREKDVLIMLDIAHYMHAERAHLSSVPKKRSNPEIAAKEGFPLMIGQSSGLQKIMALVDAVAPTDTSVLILGESGTGKELVVDCINSRSARRNMPVIKVNCAALPTSLIESELFGHEKGAFTGAGERRIGKFEQANGGTIFLDEIGEIPLDAQAKLLRALQEKEIERLGGNSPIRINVRVIAATNQDLETLMAAGRFRIDLYYRLNVFPIELPPLRDRKCDLPLLANHFLSYYSKLNNKSISGIGEDAMRQLMDYHWPGNIRELEHLIERNVLLSTGNMLGQILMPERRITDTSSSGAVTSIVKTFEQKEIEVLMQALQTCNGKLSGEGGAANLLDIPYSTLVSKMRKFGITKKSHYDLNNITP